MKSNIIFSLYIILFGFTSIFSQDFDENFLAIVGEKFITIPEFEARYNFTLNLIMHDKNASEGIKEELLYTIIAEKLWANEAIAQGYENNISVSTAYDMIEKMFLRDELYKQEIKNKIEISKDEFIIADKRFSKILNVSILFSENENNLKNLQNFIPQFENFEKFISNIDTLKINYKKLDITFGDLNKEIEDIIYNLEPNQFSKIVKTELGYYLFYLHKSENKIFNSAKEKYEKEKAILEILSSRKEDTNYMEFYKSFLAKQKVDVDGRIFMDLVDSIYSVFKRKSFSKLKPSDSSTNPKFFLDTKDVEELEQKLGEEYLSSVFVKFEKDPINVRKFLREISFNLFKVPSLDKDSVKICLNKTTKEYIKNELLARKGYELGLNNHLSVKKWVRIWYDNFLFQAIKNAFYNNELKPNFTINSLDIKEKNVIDESFQSEESYKSFIQKTIELSDKYGFKVDEEKLSKIELFNINVLVMRNLGFGGKIFGVPSSPPFNEWYLELQKRKIKDL